jgi:hypothetical protein
MVLVIVVMVSVVVMVMMVREIVRVDRELRRRHASPEHTIGVQVDALDREGAERVLQFVERQTGVEQRTERHVARDA